MFSRDLVMRWLRLESKMLTTRCKARIFDPLRDRDALGESYSRSVHLFKMKGWLGYVVACE